MFSTNQHKPVCKTKNFLRKIKTIISLQEYSPLYPTGSAPSKFYGTAEMHKLLLTDGIEKLPMRQIVSNVNTPTYQFAKYLAKLLSPLSQSDYTVNSTKHFIKQVKFDKIPQRYQMMSFDVKSLFISLTFNETIEITLERIYDQKELEADIQKAIKKEMLLLCTKDVHFLFEDEIYQQTDGVAIGSPFGPILTGIFIAELETTTFSTLGNLLSQWKRYVDDAYYC